MDTELVNYLLKSATLLTPSRRLAVRVRQEVASLLLKQQDAFESPWIYALEDWFHALWDQFEIRGMIDELLLTHTQSLLRWEYIIQEANQNLLRPHTAAKTALEAWTNLHHWRVSETLWQKSENIDEATFQVWANRYHQWLEENHYIDGVYLCEKLLSLMDVRNAKIIGCISPVNILILYGFEELSPLYQYFFEALTAKGWQVIHRQPIAQSPQTLIRKAFIDQEQECIAAAFWAKNLFSKGEKSIAIVAPQLADLREQIEYVFKEVFDPLSVCQPQAEVFPYFNISAATPLIQYPLIHAAVSFLKFGLSTWLLSDAIFALMNVFSTASREESFSRAKLSAILKKLPDDKINLKTMIGILHQNKEIEVPKWYEILLKLEKNIDKFLSKQPFREWAGTFRKIIKIFGWPGERILNSVEYQTVKRWDEFLNEFAACDNVLPPMDFYQALNILQKMASNIAFQPENKNAPIQILGLLEAAGQQYDNLWIMGLYSEVWPPNPSPNPFISTELQRQKNMPHASAQRELAYAKKVIMRFKESAQRITVSYPLQDKEKTLEASELICDIPLKVSDGIHLIERCEFLFPRNTSLEQILDENGPKLTQEEAFKGSTSTLTLQALCPFKAFAELRLKAAPFHKPKIWLEPHQQGSLLHKILEEFWQSYKSSDKLKTLEAQELEKKVNDLIEENILAFTSKSIPAPYIEVEKNRLKQILYDYISIEKERPYFTVIAAEKWQHYELANIRFTFRLDRIDKTNQDEIIITDYKTGQFKISDLLGERPKSPQLGLYYLAAYEMLPKAIMVIKLNSQGCEYEGISETDVAITGVKPLSEVKDKRKEIPKEWAELKIYWENHLQSLAQEFKNGYARVSPLEGPLTCQYCHLSSVCRIHEQETPYE